MTDSRDVRDDICTCGDHRYAMPECVCLVCSRKETKPTPEQAELAFTKENEVCPEP
jgi:hypothetical protein